MAHRNSDTKESIEPACSTIYVAPVKALVGGRRLRGLSWNKTHQLWRVRIYYAGKLRFVGRFQDAVTAAKAYDKAAFYLYGTNAITNFGIEACLVDPLDVGSCIVRAKEEAEQPAAAHYNSGSSNATHMSATSTTAAVEGSNQGQPQQRQQLPTCRVSHAGSITNPSAAAHNQQTPHTVCMNWPISCQQQQQFCLPVTMGLSLPSQQHQPFTSAAGVAFAAAVGTACGLPAAAAAADQGSLMQLLLEMQQQQQHLGFGGWQAPDNWPPVPQPSLLNPSTPKAAATCHHLFTQQPQVLQLTADSSFSVPLSPTLPAAAESAPPAAAAGAERFGLNTQQQPLQLLSHFCDYQSAQFQQQQQQQSFEHQLQTMSLQCSTDGGQAGQNFTAPQTGGTSIMRPAQMLNNGCHAGTNTASSSCVGTTWLRQS